MGRCTKGSETVKTDTVFKKTFNDVLEHLADRPAKSPLDSETRLSERFEVSRTTIRKVISGLAERRIISSSNSRPIISRKPTEADYFPLADTVATSDRVEKKFMEWMLRGDRRPGDYINGLELARQFDVSTSAIRDYLNRFARFGLVEKRPNSGWIFRGFTAGFALELFEVRELFEIRSAKTFAAQPPEHHGWQRLRDLEAEHRRLLQQIGDRYHDFSDLDERFHRLINDASNNRFMADFYDIISLIFHYHYQWRKADEEERNTVAIGEHLDYIEALLTRNPATIEAACRRHLASARNTLLASIG
jgi:DNA-binding GntR family transcriptional regulator